MTFTPITIGYDATHQNIASLPRGAQAAGYTTGSPDIRWTDPDWAAHPGALRICQDWDVSEDLATRDADLLAIVTSDYLDVETGAATNADAPGWYKQALASYHAATRPGQRWPGFYTSANNVTPLVNALIAGGVTSGPRLIIANWNLNQPQAAAALAAALADLAALGLAGDPFPVAGFQFADPGPFDIDLYSTAWLDAVSAKPPPAGPYRHIADGKHSLAQIAAARNTTATHLAAVSEHAYAVSLDAQPLQAGLPYWTSNP